MNTGDRRLGLGLAVVYNTHSSLVRAKSIVIRGKLMPTAKANGLEIEYEIFGEPDSPALLLIMGLGAQMIYWEEEFCLRLVRQGLRVIRFDNRDVGLSTKFSGFRNLDLTAALSAMFNGKLIAPPYTLEDMAADAVGLLDALNIKRAHVCGASMGGMIAQIVAIKYPDRVKSLISIMSTTGNPEIPGPAPQAGALVYTPPPLERRAYIEYAVEAGRALAGKGYPFDEDRIRRLVTREYDRAFFPQGAARQLLAVLNGANLKSALAGVTAPTLVIHGSDDPLVPVAAGRDTAEAVPGAKLLIVEGMGHDMPPVVWPVIIEAMAGLVHQAEAG